nr:hypothetical protein [uncultured Oscillibacter sp.]
MPQIQNRGAEEIRVPQPIIFMIRPSVSLTQGISPNLVPPLLVVAVPLFQPGKNSPHQLPALKAVPIIILAEKIKGSLAFRVAKELPIQA